MTNIKLVKYCACGHRKVLHNPRCSIGCGCIVYHKEDKEQTKKRTSDRCNRFLPNYET